MINFIVVSAIMFSSIFIMGLTDFSLLIMATYQSLPLNIFDGDF